MNQGEEWLASWRQRPVEDLADRFRVRGSENPEAEAEADLCSRGAANLATYQLASGIWRRMNNARSEAIASIQDLALDGRQEQAVRDALSEALWYLAFEIAYLIDGPGGSNFPDAPYQDIDEDGPSWELVETTPDGEPTGRWMSFIHEILSDAAPGGSNQARSDGWLKLSASD